MIKTKRLEIIPCSYEKLVERVRGHKGMITNDEEENNVKRLTLLPMSVASKEDQLFYTFWLGYFNGEEVIEVGFICPPTVHNVIEVWFYTRPGFMNNGYATEAVAGMIEWAKQFDNVHHICASVEDRNFASKKVLIKNGFRYLTIVNNMNIFNLVIKF